MKIVVIVLSFLGCLLLAHTWAMAQSSSPPSFGTPYVRFDLYNGTGGICNGQFTRTLYNTSGSSSILSLGGCEQYVVVTTSVNGGAGQPNIGFISMSGGRSGSFGPIQLYFSPSVPGAVPPQIPFGVATPTPIGGNLAGIDTSSTLSTTALYGGVSGAITGFVNVGQIAYLRADGGISAGVTAANGYQFGNAYIDASAVLANIAITSGRLERLRALSGNISGSVSAATIRNIECLVGSISGSITATNDIGSVIVAGAITSPTISASTIGVIDAGGAINSSITASTTAVTPASALQRLRGTSFAGSLNVNRIEKLSTQGWTNAIELSGASTANITVRNSTASPVSISGGVIAGQVSLGTVSSTVNIGASLSSTLTMASTATSATINVNNLASTGRVFVTGAHAGNLNFGASSPTVIKGIGSQVILNAGNATPSAWTGNIRYAGGTLLLPTITYDDTPADLGGGAVGLAPFRFYQTDSIPSSAASNALGVKAVLKNEQPIRAAYYGPLMAASTPMTIQFRQN